MAFKDITYLPIYLSIYLPMFLGLANSGSLALTVTSAEEDAEYSQRMIFWRPYRHHHQWLAVAELSSLTCAASGPH